jgi:hypothetical protein
MFLNSDYGDFGMFTMPSKLVQGILSIAGLFLFLYYFTAPIRHAVDSVLKFGAEAFTFSLANLSLQKMMTTAYWWTLGHNYLTVVLLLALFLLSGLIAYLAAVHTNEKALSQGSLPLLGFLSFYFLVAGSIWLIAIKDIVKGKARKW